MAVPGTVHKFLKIAESGKTPISLIGAEPVFCS